MLEECTTFYTTVATASITLLWRAAATDEGPCPLKGRNFSLPWIMCLSHTQDTLETYVLSSSLNTRLYLQVVDELYISFI